MEQLIINSSEVLTKPIVENLDVVDQIIQGLLKEQKELPPKLFYDQKGSDLFDRICQLDEYYPTRTETAIMQNNIHAISEMIGPNSLLIEYGSGSSVKTKFLLDHLKDLAAYIPVDISRDHLFRTAQDLREIYKDLEIIPVWADYSTEFELPWVKSGYSHKLAYFPGSTIGNFYPHEVVDFLYHLSKVIGVGGGFLVGVDLQKDSEVLNLAYNDRKGSTAAFNLNMLTHINREYQADFNVEAFQHCAFYNQKENRIEMHLVNLEDQFIRIGGVKIFIASGESILTEVSYKYTIEGFAQLAAQVGFEAKKVWVDPKEYFSVHYLVVND